MTFIKTPVFHSHFVEDTFGLDVNYKMECYQPTGSFKIRGMVELVNHYAKIGSTNFIASSGGNAGYSLAYACKLNGYKLKVIVPKTTSDFMIDKIKSMQATVEVIGTVWDEADAYARKLAKNENAVYVSPFDDPLLWKGHSSLIKECINQIKQPDKIVVAVGGGGLLCGVLQGVKHNGWQDSEIITVETEGAASFYESYKKGTVIQLPKITSIATSLGAKIISSNALKLAQELNINPQIVSDDNAVEATKIFFQEYNTLVEPACGAALSIPYSKQKLFKSEDKILVIVCGGVNTNYTQLN